MKRNSDSVFKHYYIADAGTTYEGDKSYRIIGTEDQTYIIDSASDKEINESISYVKRMEKNTDGISIPLYNFHAAPLIRYSRVYGKFIYSIFGITIDPKAVPCVINFLRENDLLEKDEADFRIHINKENTIYKVSLI